MKHAITRTLTLAAALWIGAAVTAATLPTDLTASATLTASGQYSTYSPELLRDGNPFGTYWITNSTATPWAAYSWTTPQYLSYAFIGSNEDRRPDGMTVQYSVNDDGVWVDAGSLVPFSTTVAALDYVPIAQTAKAVRVALTDTAPSYYGLDSFRIYGSATAPGFPTNMATDMAANAAVQLTNTWENNLGAVTVETHLTDRIVPTSSLLRANGDLPDKPEMILTWTTDQQVAGIALANRQWSGGLGSGSILEMHVDALPEGMDPVLATAGDWSLVGSYSDVSTDSKIIHLPFDSLLTRGLRLVVTDVGDGPYGTARAGGDFSELIVIGGIIVPEPGTLALLVLGGFGLLARRARSSEQ